MAGWLFPIFAPALVTLPSSSSARSATMRLRSVPPSDMLARPPLAAVNLGVPQPSSQTKPRQSSPCQIIVTFWCKKYEFRRRRAEGGGPVAEDLDIDLNLLLALGALLEDRNLTRADRKSVV